MNRFALLFLGLAISIPLVANVTACVTTTTVASDPAANASSPDGSTPSSNANEDDGDASSGDAGSSHPAVPPLPVIPHQGGPVIAKPEIVTITWQGDPIADGLEAFDKWMVASTFWKDLMSEWGVGPGTYVGSHRVPVPAPSTLDDNQIQQILQDGFALGTIPRPNGSRIYVVYPPAGTTVTNFGMNGCTSFQAYHGSFDVGASDAGPATTLALYAVAPRCESTGGLTPLDFTTWGQSHEVMETASDPISEKPAWRIDVQSLATPELGENADLCTGHPTRVDGYMVTRNWSNVAAKAGKRPCVPAPPGAMFGLFADSGEVTIKPGQTLTMKVHAYTSGGGGTLNPFPVRALAYDPKLHVSLDIGTSSKVSDGDELTLTIQPAADWIEMEGKNLVFLLAQSDNYTTKRHVIVHAK